MNWANSAGLVLRSFEVSVNPNMIVALTSPGYPIVRVNAALTLRELEERQAARLQKVHGSPPESAPSEYQSCAEAH